MRHFTSALLLAIHVASLTRPAFASDPPATSVTPSRAPTAAPASETPPPASAFRVPTREPVEVEFRGDAPDVSFAVQTGVVSGYAYSFRHIHYVSGRTSVPICVAPCRTVMAPGTYSFGVSKGNGPINFVDNVTLRGPSIVRSEYKSNETLRLLGVGVGLVGTGTGLLLMATSEQEGEERQCDVYFGCRSVPAHLHDEARFDVGAAILAASVIAAIALVTRGDDVAVHVSPFAPAPVGAPVGMLPAPTLDRGASPSLVASAPGLTLSGAFLLLAEGSRCDEGRSPVST